MKFRILISIVILILLLVSSDVIDFSEVNSKLSQLNHK